MFNLNYNDVKKAKKQYSSIARKTDFNPYKPFERMSKCLSQATDYTDTTSSKSNINKDFTLGIHKVPVNNKIKTSNQMKKCSYLDFLALRKAKNTFPFGNKEKRFKWQNLKDENMVLYPEIYKRPHKKQFLLKETFGEGHPDFISNKNKFDKKPKIKRLRRCYSEQSLEMNKYIKNNGIDVTRRVIVPEFNKEPIKSNNKRSYSLPNFKYNRTNGNFKSLFNLTPIDIPIKSKKFYKSKSFGVLSINLFDDNYGKYEIPTNTKKHFFDNRCHFDNIKELNLISDMNKCYKNRRNKSVNSTFREETMFYLNRDINNMKLRKYEISHWSKTVCNKSTNKLKRNIKT